MVKTEALERLEKARAMEKGCPWELPEYNQPQSLQSPMIMWSGDAWDASRAYLDAVKAIESAVERLGTEVAICQNVGANGTAHALLETREILAAALPH